MKKYKCRYLDNHGCFDDESPEVRVEASSVEEAAQVYSQCYPSHYLRINVLWGTSGGQIITNPAPKQREDPLEEETAERESGTSPEYYKGGLREASAGGYSLVVTQKAPMLYSLFRFFGWLALGLIPLGVLVAIAEESGEHLGEWVLTMCYGVVMLWGSAQLIKLLHSIAWNTQEARRERIES